MYTVTLYSFCGPGIKISMDMYFNDEGQLIFDGCDIGKNVKDHWGDSNYEYMYTIDPEHVLKIYDFLTVTRGKKRALLTKIKELFAGEGAYRTFGEFLDKEKIEYCGYTYA